MGRPRQPEIRQRILDACTDYSLERGLPDGLEPLATASGTSPRMLIYHFGTRDELVRDIIEAIATRQRGFETVFDPKTVTVESYLAGLRKTFDQSLEPRNLALQRLEFEAEMLEVLSPEHDLTRSAHDALQARARDTLVALGLNPADAGVEAQLLLDTFYGIQVGLVRSGDPVRATAAFERALEYHSRAIAPFLAVP